MKIKNLFENRERTVFSFEVFPPKKSSPIESVFGKMEELCALNPDFISVTYGAGGTAGHSRTCEIAAKIKHDFGVECMAHLTCINNTKADINKNLADLKSNGVENILALRGDYVEGSVPSTDFKYASDLCEFINSNPEYRDYFDIGGGCYPEVHGEAEDEVEDILNLKKKVDAGTTHLISQLFFDNSVYYRFLERAKIARINVPIEAGIMPITNKNLITRTVSMSGACLPSKFSKILQKYENNPEALRDAGIAYAIEQIIDLITNGVDGIHLYTMNNPYTASKITEAIKNLL